MSYTCGYCGEPILNPRQTRHCSLTKLEQLAGEGRLFCCREHAVYGMQQVGFYKEISVKGRPVRSKAVAKSNQAHPRRKPTNQKGS